MPNPNVDLHVAFPEFDTSHYCTCGWHLPSQCGACDCCAPKPPPDHSWLEFECVGCRMEPHTLPCWMNRIRLRWRASRGWEDVVLLVPRLPNPSREPEYR